VFHLLQVLEFRILGTADPLDFKRFPQQTGFRPAQGPFKTRFTLLYKCLVRTSQRRPCASVRSTYRL